MGEAMGHGAYDDYGGDNEVSLAFCACVCACKVCINQVYMIIEFVIVICTSLSQLLVITYWVSFIFSKSFSFVLLLLLFQTYDSDQEDENEGKEGNTVTVKNDKNDKEERTGKDGSANFSKGERGGGGGEKKDYRKDRAKDKDKDKDGGREGDSSGQWRNKSSSGGDRQSAIRPRVENNRAARRAGK